MSSGSPAGSAREVDPIAGAGVLDGLPMAFLVQWPRMTDLSVPETSKGGDADLPPPHPNPTNRV